MADDTHKVTLQLPAEYNLTEEQMRALSAAIKVQLATVQKDAQVANLLSLPETNIFLRKPRKPKGSSPAKKKKKKP